MTQGASVRGGTSMDDGPTSVIARLVWCNSVLLQIQLSGKLYIYFQDSASTMNVIMENLVKSAAEEFDTEGT